jgi:hypothetical protein
MTALHCVNYLQYGTKLLQQSGLRMGIDLLQNVFHSERVNGDGALTFSAIIENQTNILRIQTIGLLLKVNQSKNIVGVVAMINLILINLI